MARWNTPVDFTHPKYDEFLSKWVRARDVLEGEDKLKVKGEAYLPRLDSQSDEEYARYVRRASFYNATARSRDGFSGLIFRREPITTSPGERDPLHRYFAEFRMDADLAGHSLDELGRWLVQEVLSVGRAGTLVEWSDEEGR